MLYGQAKYDSYKDSGVDWNAQQVPSDWSIVSTLVGLLVGDYSSSNNNGIRPSSITLKHLQKTRSCSSRLHKVDRDQAAHP
jgi:hypothetical protein